MTEVQSMVNVVDLQRRTMRYEFADGIREFQLALWLIWVGVYSWVVWDKLPEWGSMVEAVRAMGSGVAVIVFLVLPIAIPVLASHYGLMWINERVRRRWLWRNTGYIKPRQWVVPRRVILGGCALAMGVLVLGILAAIHFREFSFLIRSIYVGSGLNVSIMMGMLGKAMEVRRFGAAARWALIGTAVVVTLPVSNGLCGLMVCGYLAGVLMISGWQGLREMAAQQEALDDAH